jgi:hypothetical protein
MQHNRDASSFIPLESISASQLITNPHPSLYRLALLRQLGSGFTLRQAQRAERRDESMLGLAAQVHEPVHCSHHDAPADDVAQRHRQQIVDEKFLPRQVRELFGCFAGGRHNLGFVSQQQAERDEIHVRDRVFETNCDERCDWRYNRQYFIGRRASAKAQPNGQDYERVAKYAQHQGRDKIQANLGIGDIQSRGPNLEFVERPLP